MPEQRVFCNSPWYELHIYWDGSLAFCCHATPNVPYDASLKHQYNIKNMSIKQWYDSAPMREARMRMLGDRQWNHCDRCWHEERVSDTSRRHRSNQKSVIFTKQNFAESYQQSPGFPKFEHSRVNQGSYDGLPIDLHVDLGNYCNLACKMCDASASSTIASQEVRWGIQDSKKYLGSDWTRDDRVWQRFVQQILDIPYLQNIHFMGGETLLTDRLEDLVDRFVAARRFDMCFSFVTNGTIYRPGLVEKLAQFQRVGFEISIETADQHNSYIRQGTDTDLVLTNIGRYRGISNGTSVSVTLRPALNLLSIGYYHTLLRYALDHGLLVKNNLLHSPTFLDARYLPNETKLLYLDQYQQLRQSVPVTDSDLDINISDPNNYQWVISREIDLAISMLRTIQPDDAEQQHQRLVSHCEKWDAIYGLDARVLYPELLMIFSRYGY